MDRLLELRRVSLTFLRGARRFAPVLAEVTLDVHAGEQVAVLGPHAEGKTTLLRVAAGFERPDDGHVLFEGRDLWEMSDRRRSALLAGGMALVDHRRPDLDLTVRELVALPVLRRGRRREAFAAADGVLARLGLSECAEQRWESLADHERALLTVARGVVSEPRLLLVDDLLVGLGLGSADEVGRLVRDVALERGMAMLMSVSEAGSTAWCDRVASLAGGRLVLPARAEPQRGRLIEFPVDPRRRASP